MTPDKSPAETYAPYLYDIAETRPVRHSRVYADQLREVLDIVRRLFAAAPPRAHIEMNIGGEMIYFSHTRGGNDQTGLFGVFSPWLSRNKLIEAGGDALAVAIAALYADRANWTTEFDQR